VNDECGELLVGFTGRVTQPDEALRATRAYSTSIKRGKACTIAKVKYITSANEIPVGQKCLCLVKNTRKRDMTLASPLRLPANSGQEVGQYARQHEEAYKDLELRLLIRTNTH
jgi:hypothetical protein